MKAISILQPWASLAVTIDPSTGLACKQIETRSWNTKYRGPLLIHASANRKGIGRQLAYTNPFIDCLPKKNDVLYYDELPFGAIIGQVNLVDTIPAEVIPNHNQIIIDCTNGDKKAWDFTEQEIAFGEYTPGRWGWLLSDPVLFKTPIRAKGKLGLWEAGPELLEKILNNIDL